MTNGETLNRTDPLPTADGIYTCGSLRYNRRQLVWLFAMILLADFTLTLMESVVPALMPLSLKDIGASNSLIGLVATIGSAMNMVLNPIISTASDRHRGPRGRRIPFILWTIPFVALFLVLIGYSPALGNFLHAKLLGNWGISKYAVTVTLLFSFMVLFQGVNLFVNCVYWYIFADLVPHVLMGRFLGLLRIVGQLALWVWGTYIFGLADQHMEAIYLGAGLLYAGSFMLFCWQVKEGEYPPPEPRKGGKGIRAWLKDYFHTCTRAPLWRWMIVMVVAFQISQVSNTYWTFFGRDTLGCSLSTIGKIAGWGSLISIPLVMLVGWMVDRIGPIPLVMVGAIFSTLVAIGGYFHIHNESTLMLYGVLTTIGLVWTQSAMMPLYILLFPSTRYGQFCSAVNMISMIGAIVTNYLMGLLMDWLGDYRMLLLWRSASWAIMIPALVMIWVFYRRHGGRDSYLPPGTEGSNDLVKPSGVATIAMH